MASRGYVSQQVRVLTLLLSTIAGCAVTLPPATQPREPARLGMPQWVASRTNVCQQSTMEVAEEEGRQTLTFRSAGLLLDSSASPAMQLSSRCAFAIVLKGDVSQRRTVHVELTGRRQASPNAVFTYQLEVGTQHARRVHPPVPSNLALAELVTASVSPGENELPVVIRAAAEPGSNVRVEIGQIRITLEPSRAPVQRAVAAGGEL